MEDAVEAAKLIVSAHDDPNCSVHAYMKVKNKALSVIGTVGLARALISSSERVKELEEALEWALAEIDVLSNRLVEFAYPQAMPMVGRQDQIERYVAARKALPTPRS